MRRPPFTVRWLMAAVAFAAGVLGGARWHRRAMARRPDYQSRAWVHELKEDIYRGEFEGCIHGGRIPGPDARKAAYHAAMRRKYEDAAAWPWFPVASDPPEP